MTVVPDYIKRAAPYQAGKPIEELAREIGLAEPRILKLASNENPLGMGHLARDATQNALLASGRYPDSNGHLLKSKLEDRFSVPSEQIVLGNGSNDVLELVASTFLHAGTEAVFSQYGFIVYQQATNRTGATCVEVPAKEYGHDLEAMLAAIGDRTRVVFIANPNNPTGTFIAGERLYWFLRRVPENVIVVLDEAYSEYLPASLQYDSTEWLNEFPNLFICRTFSKAYGLAGLRVGYGLGSPQVIEYANRIRQAFNVSNVALAAAAAALDDDEHLRKTQQVNAKGMHQLEVGFDSLRLSYVPSVGNFILVKVPGAAKCNEHLLRNGIIVRPVGAYGLPDWLRISIGREADNFRVLEALQAHLEGHQA